MDSINVKTVIGDSEREFAVDPNGLLLIGMTDSKPHSSVLTDQQWDALWQGFTSSACTDYFKSGSAVQQEAYALFIQLHSPQDQPQTTGRRSGT